MRFERRYARPPDEVWRALTEPDVLSVWFDPLIDYPGSRLEFADGASLLYVAKDAHLFSAQAGQVTRFEPPYRLEFTRASQVWRWALAAAGEGATILVLTVVDGQAAAMAALERLDTTLTSR